MGKLKRLLQSYERFIRTPWRDDVAAAQRVVFCVYDPVEERALRSRIGEFELATAMAFDLGVACVVVGAVLMALAQLAQVAQRQVNAASGQQHQEHRQPSQEH